MNKCWTPMTNVLLLQRVYNETITITLTKDFFKVGSLKTRQTWTILYSHLIFAKHLQASCVLYRHRKTSLMFWFWQKNKIYWIFQHHFRLSLFHWIERSYTICIFTLSASIDYSQIRRTTIIHSAKRSRIKCKKKLFQLSFVSGEQFEEKVKDIFILVVGDSPASVKKNERK